MEACPQFNDKTGFVGAATISQVRLFNAHPTGKGLKVERLQALMGDGGIQECGYAQNCVEVCPKDIPLTKAISKVGGDVMKQALGDLFRQFLNSNGFIEIHSPKLQGAATESGASVFKVSYFKSKSAKPD